jgi:hypothetical protein
MKCVISNEMCDFCYDYLGWLVMTAQANYDVIRCVRAKNKKTIRTDNPLSSVHVGTQYTTFN